MASRLNPTQFLALISHTSPLKFEVLCKRDVTLVFFQGDKPEEVATTDLEALADVRSGVEDMGYAVIDEWRAKGESGYIYAKQ